MPYLTEIGDPIPSLMRGDKAQPPSCPSPNRITPGFNAALFAFSAALGVFKFVVGPGMAKGVSLEGLVLTVALDAVRFAVVLLITAFFVKAFWLRLISSIFPIRPINYQEAIAIVLIIGILFAT